MPPIILASTVATSSPGAITFANNLRVASIAVAAYEYVAGRFSLALVLTQYSDSYIITLPSEYRLYKTSSQRR